MIVKLLTEHHLEFLSLKGGCTDSSEFALVKMSNCWNSHAAAHNIIKYKKVTCVISRSGSLYSKTCVKRPLSRIVEFGLNFKTNIA